MKKQGHDTFPDGVIVNKKVHTDSHGSHHEALGHYTHVDQVHGHLGIPATFHFIKSVPDYGKEPSHSCNDGKDNNGLEII